MKECWVILVTDGTVIEYPPEVYRSARQARQEAERWAGLLSADGQFEVRSPFEGRYEVGFRDIRVAQGSLESDGVGHNLWVGTFWSRDGYPDPEAIILSGKKRAMDWASAPLDPGNLPTEVSVSRWHIAATFDVRGEKAYAVANRAKIVCGTL